jgi:glycosyltransferase involved in cell wall biosynthesis
MDISVIICAHNPRPDYLERVLGSLRNQRLPKDKWELLVIDNASEVSVASQTDISWHPKARHIFESELGLAPARRRGMREAVADLLVFVDDDNILDDGYLFEALTISRDWPSLGVWGSGAVSHDYEVDPPEYLREFLYYLPIRQVAAPQWSNVPSCFPAIPFGAGFCVRSTVGAAYREYCAESQIQITGRRGKNLSSGEDTEICFIACKQGFGMGVFPQLKLKHLIPKDRISEKYLLNLVESSVSSLLLMQYKWNSVVPPSPFATKGLLSILKTIMIHRGMDRRARFARLRATAKARRLISLIQDGRQIEG